jgi:hypothetical protein
MTIEGIFLFWAQVEKINATKIEASEVGGNRYLLTDRAGLSGYQDYDAL